MVFPALHGENGEDGAIQGFLETLNINYVGSSYEASSLCMNKAFAKRLVEAEGIEVSPFFDIRKNGYDKNEVIAKAKNLRFPLYVKGVHLGSSLGVKRRCFIRI